VRALGLAGLLPAALVTLVLVHQPAVGDRRLYPLLRGPMTVVGLALAALTVIAWVTTSDRLERSALGGLAWAGVTAILCIGPFLESTPRVRLYALDVETGDVVWASNRAGAAPVLVDGDLVVTDVASRSLVGLDPRTGRERWRHSIDGAEVPLVARAVAAGAFVPASPSPSASESVVEGDRSLTLALPGEQVVAVATTEDQAFGYVSTAGADGVSAGAVICVDAAGGEVRWRAALPDAVAVGTGTAAIGANDDVVVVAGGERVGVLDADDGALRWTESVVTLGKSRGYALPGAVQHVAVSDALVFLSTAPDT
jgi:outer membrane protein assembly factor BamB